MAEISQNSGQKSEGRVRVKKMSTKIDMTPMVDLAFLLLTFFILTATFKDVRFLRVSMPNKEGTPPPINEKNVLNLVLAEQNEVYWWMGISPPVNTTNYSATGIRRLLIEKLNANPNIIVLLKPKDESKYENIVDVLDEFVIAGIQKYSIVSYSDDDKTIINAATGSLSQANISTKKTKFDAD
jgi:biopolymer transport protein ExbD